MNSNVFRNPWLFRRHPVRWLRCFFRSFKYAWQRITRGWADCDVWEMDEYLLQILPEMLDALASRHDMECVDPNIFWQIAQHFMNARKDQRVQINEYQKELHATIHSVEPEQDISRLEISQKYWARELEIKRWRIEQKDRAFDMLKEVFFDLWY